MRQWSEGEIYYYSVHRLESVDEDQDSWELGEVVDSCGGLYGDKYAEEQALEALESAISAAKVNA